MEPGHGPKLGNQYLSEVKRVLKVGGKFICLTLGESHVLALLLPKFRYGWKMSIHAIPQKTSNGSSLQTLMVIAEKDNSAMLCPISSSMLQSFVDSNGSQAMGVSKALDTENDIRSKHSSYSDIIYTLEDLKIGAKGKLEELSPGRRVQLTLGELVASSVYRAVLLDAPQDSGPFIYDFGAFLVPKTRAREWLFSSEEGQWLIVENSKAARLVMIFLDISHASLSMDEIQKDLSPLVKQLAQGGVGDGVKIPFLAASDGIKERSIVHQVASTLTGPIIIDDVIYEKVDDDISTLIPSEDVMFRRLTFERSECLVQSEAVLTSGGEDTGPKDQKKTSSGKRGNPKKSISPASPTQENNLKVDHNYLASSYHTAIISGFMLISAYLGKIAATRSMVKTSVIGLGAGLLPMFLHRCLPFLDIEVLELDPVVLDLARDHFGFIEDKYLKVHITDGIKHIEEAAKMGATLSESCESSNGGLTSGSLDILIVDVDSSDSSSGISCPAPDFLEESFLLAAKNSLSEHGLFIINLVSRSQDLKDGVFSRLKTVFGQLFSLQLDEDVNEVVFAIKSETCLKEDDFSEACNELAKLLTLEKASMSQRIIGYASKVKNLS
ncbi:hypothetical protein Leryth_005802 [Lithospermum erythrorhizon]|nr:hypothetical protein Leryth_005802 [Lithospermum erythrorhizon]